MCGRWDVMEVDDQGGREVEGRGDGVLMGGCVRGVGVRRAEGGSDVVDLLVKEVGKILR